MRLIDCTQVCKQARLFKDGPYIVEAVSVSDIWNCPAINAEAVKHGKWIFVGSSEDGTVCKCSECGEMFSFNGNTYLPAYCGDCGAKMDGEKGE